MWLYSHTPLSFISISLPFSLVFLSSMEDLEFGDQWQRLEECQGKEASSQVLDWAGGPSSGGEDRRQEVTESWVKPLMGEEDVGGMVNRMLRAPGKISLVSALRGH